jgi:hypothetical protein
LLKQTLLRLENFKGFVQQQLLKHQPRTKKKERLKPLKMNKIKIKSKFQHKILTFISLIALKASLSVKIFIYFNSAGINS